MECWFCVVFRFSPRILFSRPPFDRACIRQASVAAFGMVNRRFGFVWFSCLTCFHMFPFPLPVCVHWYSWQLLLAGSWEGFAYGYLRICFLHLISVWFVFSISPLSSHGVPALVLLVARRAWNRQASEEVSGMVNRRCWYRPVFPTFDIFFGIHFPLPHACIGIGGD